MANDNDTPQRTRQHIIATISLYQVGLLLVERGFTLTVSDQSADYGYDLDVTTYDKNGHIENGGFLVQLKASEGFRRVDGGKSLSFTITRKHYNLWKNEPMPVFLILYDVGDERAYWLYLQEYFAAGHQPRKNADSLTVRVPIKNKFTRRTVNYIYNLKQAVVKQLKGKIKHGK